MDTRNKPIGSYEYFAPIYQKMVWAMPNWRAWLESVLPDVEGPMVLDVSFGIGYLLGQLASRMRAFGVDNDPDMVALAQKNLSESNSLAWLQMGDAHHLPYRSGSFDTVLCTMAINSYEDQAAAFWEMVRVLKSRGKLLLLDISMPTDRNPEGTALFRLWQRKDPTYRDIKQLIEQTGMDFDARSIGGFGAVQLFIIRKPKKI